MLNYNQNKGHAMEVFTIDGIDGVITANTVNLVVPVGTDLTALVPTITLSGSGASVTPGSGCKLLVKKGRFYFSIDYKLSLFLSEVFKNILLSILSE